MTSRKRFSCWIVALILFISAYGSFPISYAESSALSGEQTNAIAMLNYITVLTQDINDSRNNRLYLQKAYSSLINNIYPNAVDGSTLGQLTELLDTMEQYRMLDVKRERLIYIYEQQQAKAIKAALPSPADLLSVAKLFDPKKIALSLAPFASMAVNSIAIYNSMMQLPNQKYLSDGWELNDDEASILHNSRKGIFGYMIRMVGDYKLPGDLVLTEDAVSEFVSWKNNDNIIGRIQFLESNQDTYSFYGGYWLVLAESYYQAGEWNKCLDAIASYEAIDVRIFRRDYDYARVLPLAVAAAAEIYTEETYIEKAAHFTQVIVDNTDHSDWALRYFVAQTYIDLYTKTNDITWLNKAYDITLDNCNYLVNTQRKLNATYLAPVAEEKAAKDATRDVKRQISDYNKMLKETRKTEMPPIYEPLRLNCDLLFALADTLSIPETEKTKIDGILHVNGEPLFMSSVIDAQYWFVTPVAIPEEIDVEYGGTALIMPVTLMSGTDTIQVSIQTPSMETALVINDWKIDQVHRDIQGDVSTYRVAYASESARKISWQPDAIINIDIVPLEGNNTTYHFEYTTVGTKREWYDYLKVWEGHKNNWYDYAKVWENSVNFERTK